MSAHPTITALIQDFGFVGFESATEASKAIVEMNKKARVSIPPCPTCIFVLAKRQYFMWKTHQEDSLILQSESSKWLWGIYRNGCSDRSRSLMARHLKCDCGRRSRKKKSESIFKIRSFAHLFWILEQTPQVLSTLALELV